MQPKTGFSPWHTKENSFEQDHTSLHVQNSHKDRLSNKDKLQKWSQSKLSSRKKIPLENQTHSFLRSLSKTDHFLTAFLQDNATQSFRRKVTRSSQKIDSEAKDEKSCKKFDDQKWRVLTITSNDRFKSECADLRRCQHLATQLKSRRSSLRPGQPNQQKQKPSLQEVSIKNFIIHGHYTDKDSLYQLGKRRDASYVMKQKFATLKKTVDSKENNEPSGRKVVVVRGNAKEQDNLFKVIKIEREINFNNNRLR